MGPEAVKLYRQMPPALRNSVTDICILNACSHAGLVDEARSIFSQISNKTERIVTNMVSTLLLMVTPTASPSLAFQIDCYSRLFMFEEAQQLIEQHERSHSPYLVMYSK